MFAHLDIVAAFVPSGSTVPSICMAPTHTSPCVNPSRPPPSPLCQGEAGGRRDTPPLRLRLYLKSTFARLSPAETFSSVMPLVHLFKRYMPSVWNFFVGGLRWKAHPLAVIAGEGLLFFLPLQHPLNNTVSDQRRRPDANPSPADGE